MSPTVVQAREGQRNSISVSQTKGLLNGPGQNNCFLNSAVQVLWHLDIFRRSFRELGGHACMEDSCIFCALKELFAQFQYSRESALPPDALRRALAETFFNQQRFQLGFMDDAAECFENILLRIHFHIANTESEDMCNATHCIPHQKFAMTLVEQSICHSCGATSEPLPFTQMVHYVSASAMCMQAKQLWKEGSQMGADFGQLLRRAGGMGDIRDCPSSCGAKIQICRSLMNRPEIVSVGIVWDSEHPTLEHIMNVFSVIGTTVHLPDVFHSVVDRQWASSTVHHLVGVVTYYGKHYSTFFFHTKLHVWIYFDDATVREIGPRWEQVVEKCHRGHFQPLLLLYANPQGVPISLETAPQNITYVTGNGKAKEELPKQDACKASCNPDRSRFYLNGHAAIQRRAVTPNPESARELMKDTCQRRALTPNPDTFIGGDIRPLSPKGVPQSQLSISRNNEDKPYAQSCGLSKPLHPVNVKIPHNVNGDTAGMAVDEHDNVNQHLIDPTMADVSKQSIKSNMYISRKTVENVLNYQKLQRQRSLSTGNYSSIGSRNSNSSLESFENTVRPKNTYPGSPPDNKSDLIEFAGLGRRRDSGNWSGDRNSASSGSSLSLETPHFYIAAKQPCGPAYRQQPGKPLEIMTNPMYDPGYDSYSLSSNDSYPLSPQAKHNQQLAQIPEVPIRDYCDANSIQLHNKEAVDECVKLCIEADHFLEKSRGLEDSGEFAAAVSLCNSAAAKARAAMDAPYTNPQSLMFARMKHNTCVMRARSLHRRFLMRQESINSHGSTTSTETDSGDTPMEKLGNHSRQASSDSQKRKDSHSRQNSKDGTINHSRQNSRESRQSIKEFSSHSRQGSKDSTKKSSINIEIYATLPKKLGKKKLEKMTTGSIRAKDDKFIHQTVVQKIQMPDSFKQDCNHIEKNMREVMYKEKKKDSGKSDRDTEFSDYASEWEMTKKSTKLHRTYSSPPIRTTSSSIQQTVESNKDKPDGAKVNAQPGKKQHKIRRKLLMGGLIRRKNRSMPDLREGQDGSDPLQSQHSFDDLQLNQGDKVKRNLTGYLSDAHLDYVQSEGMEKSKIHYGSCRQLSQLQNKMPPQPPVRTTSQLSLSTAMHQMPQSKPAVLAKMEPPSIPTNNPLKNGHLLRNSTLINQNHPHNQTNRPSPVQHQIINHNRKPAISFTTQAVIHPPVVTQSPTVMPQQQPLPIRTETRIDMPPDVVINDLVIQYGSYTSGQQLTGLPVESNNSTKCNSSDNSNYTHMKPSTKCASSTTEGFDHVVENRENGLLQELQVKRHYILNRKTHQEDSNPREAASKTEEKIIAPVKQRNSWLEELQVKQCQMLQRRSLEHHQGTQLSNHQSSINNDDNGTCKTQPTIQPKRSLTLNLNQLVPNQVQQSSDQNDVTNHPCSVRDLASRFEQIVSPTATKPPVTFPQEISKSGLASNLPETKPLPTTTLQTITQHEIKVLPPMLSGNQASSSHLGTKKDIDQFPRPDQPSPKPVSITSHNQHEIATTNSNNLSSDGAMAYHENQAKLVYEVKPPPVPYPTITQQQPNYMHCNGHLKSNFENQNSPSLPSRGHPVNMQPPPSVQSSNVQKDWSRMVNSNLRNLGREGQQPPPYHAAINALHRPPSVVNHSSFPHQVQPPKNTIQTNNLVNEKTNRDINGYTDVVSTNYINQYYPGKPYAAVPPTSGQVVNYQHPPKAISTDTEKPNDYHIVQNGNGKSYIVNNCVTECDGMIKPLCNGGKVPKVPTQLTNELKTESCGVSQHNIESQIGNNNKKIKSKKSVTFSDQIALVASADDHHPEEFLPNPLLQRVYKTLVQQKSPPASNPKDKETVQVVKQKVANEPKKPAVIETAPCNPPVNELPSSGALKISNSTPKVLCHLCRKKYVNPPVVYCPDCDFYMSRFKPKS